jgi:predicted DNA-binding transcriptional regulator AlpA
MKQSLDVLPPPCVRLLSRVQAAALCGVSPNTFDRMVGEGIMPGPKRVYGRVLWDLVALNAAIDALFDEGDSAKPTSWD